MTSKLSSVVLALLTTGLVGCGEEPPFCKNSGGATECKDDNPCTTDGCDEAARKCTFLAADGGPCDDKNACTEGEKCAAGACSPGTKIDTDDKNPCTDDKCDSTKGVAHEANSADCDDKDACTDKDACKDSKCVGGTAKKCDDGNPCTIDACDKGTGCTATNSTNTCDDSNACTVGDTCKDGKCGGAPKDCNDKLDCTADSCDVAVGCKNVATTGPCDADNDACTVADACKDGKCLAGGKKDCDDGLACTENEKCDPTNGKCANKPQDGPCNDNNACTDKDACANGQCQGGAAIVCDDKNACTDDSCDPKAGCKTVANTKDCDDGSACTVGDKCADSVCKGGAVVDCPDKDGDSCTVESCDKLAGCIVKKAEDGTLCSDGNKCTEVDKCIAGKCEGGAALKCTDSKVCQDAFCDPKIGCSWKPLTDGATCDDGSKCTDKDTCKGGTCISGLDVKCTDTNFCTDDACDSKAGCVYTPNKNPCDDKNACTSGDTCKDGACAPGVPKNCNDNKECTVDECNTTTGDCGSTNAKTGTPCDDGDKCTAESFCDTAVCVGKTQVSCKDDGNVCTNDGCDKFTGCAYANNTALCNADDNVCTKDDACKDGKCVAGQIGSCDDKNPCTDDSCDKVKGCLNVPADGKDCTDGKVCTVEDKCKGGECVDVKAKNCSDGNSCTDDTCGEPGGCKNTVLLDNSACDDGDACTAGDSCASGKCIAGNMALWITKDGTAFAEGFSSVAAGSGGGFAAVGYRSLTSGNKGLLRTIDQTGKTILETLVDPPAGAGLNLIGVVGLPGGGYLAVGLAKKFFAVRTNPNGTSIDWKADIAEGNLGSDAYKYLAGLTGLPAGKAAIAAAVGYGTFAYQADGCDAGACGFGILREIDAKGATVGVHTLHPPAGATMGCKAIAWSPKGDYWIACDYGKGGPPQTRILRTEALTGKPLKAIDVDTSNKHAVIYGMYSDDTGVTAVGEIAGPNGGMDGWVLRISNDYAKIEQQYIGTVKNDYLRSVAPTGDGGWFLSGKGFGNENVLGMLVRLDKGLQPVWQRAYDGASVAAVGASSTAGTDFGSIVATATGRLVIAGSTGKDTAGGADTLLATCDAFGNCDCASSGTCITKTGTAVDDKNPCTLDWCEAGQEKHAIGNEGLTCAPSKTCQKGVCK